MPVKTRSSSSTPDCFPGVRKKLEFLRKTYADETRLFYPSMLFDEGDEGEATSVETFCLLFVQGNHSKRIRRARY